VKSLENAYRVYLSAYAVVIHYEEGLYQVYASLPFTFRYLWLYFVAISIRGKCHEVSYSSRQSIGISLGRKVSPSQHVGRRAFAVAGPTVCNSLTDNLRNPYVSYY